MKLAMPVSLSPTLSQCEREQTIRCASFTLSNSRVWYGDLKMGRVIRRYAAQVKIGYCIAGCVSRIRIVGAWVNPTLLSYI